jgi:hypothetical protein
MDIQENPSNGIRDTAEKLRVRHTEVNFASFLTDREHNHVCSMHRVCQVWSFRKIPPMEAEIQLRSYFVLQLSLLNYGAIEP